MSELALREDRDGVAVVTLNRLDGQADLQITRWA